MTVRAVLPLVLLFGAPVLPTVPAVAASFDCSKAATAFEKAICGNDALSLADERLAQTYATAIGGLGAASLEILRKDQRDWLGFVERACTADAEVIRTGSYDERGIACLTDLFNRRSTVLEGSRMVGGKRFYPISEQGALPDPNEVGNPDSYFRVATHELSVLHLDGSVPYAANFNAFVDAAIEDYSDLGVNGGTTTDMLDAESDTDVMMTLKDTAGENRITLEVTTYWYGHGAAHGQGSVSYLHYLIGEGRALAAEDLFAGKRWQSNLTRLAAEALRTQHGEALFDDFETGLEELVVDTARWDLSDNYDLIIQFNPYEVSAYAYGTPTARISWEALYPYLGDSADTIRFGY